VYRRRNASLLSSHLRLNRVKEDEETIGRALDANLPSWQGCLPYRGTGYARSDARLQTSRIGRWPGHPLAGLTAAV